MTTPETDLLKGLAADEAQALLDLGRLERVPAGAALFRLGAEAGALYIVQRGRVRLTLPIHVGGRAEEVTVEERSPGQMVGWSGLVPPHRYTLNASAPLETEVLTLPRSALLAHLSARPAVGHAVCLNLASIVGQRLQVLQAMWLREMQRNLDRQPV